MEKKEENGKPTETRGGPGSCGGFAGDEQKDAEQCGSVQLRVRARICRGT